MFKRNEYQDLPMPKRAQDIVTEARQRLAASGGKASDLPMMIEKVTAQYRQKDDVHYAGRDGHNAMQMPNNIDNYIDQVLGMSSMGGGDGMSLPQGAGAQLPDSGPIPQGRDTSDLDPQQEQEAEQIVQQGENDGLSFGQILAGLAGVGGLYAASRFLYKRYGSGDNTPVGDAAQTFRNPNASAVDQSIDAVDGKGRSVVPYDEGMSPSPDPKQGQIESGKAARLAPPTAGPDVPPAAGAAPVAPEPQPQLPPAASQQALPPPSNVEQSIEATMDEPDDIDEIMRNRVEGAGLQPSTQPRYSGRIGGEQGVSGDDALDVSEAEARELLIEKAKRMPPREAFKMIQESGIEIDDNMMRALVEGSQTVRGLKDRASDIAGGVAKTISRQAVR